MAHANHTCQKKLFNPANPFAGIVTSFPRQKNGGQNLHTHNFLPEKRNSLSSHLKRDFFSRENYGAETISCAILPGIRRQIPWGGRFCPRIPEPQPACNYAYVYVYVCMHECMRVRMHVCMHGFMQQKHTHTHTHILPVLWMSSSKRPLCRMYTHTHLYIHM